MHDLWWKKAKKGHFSRIYDVTQTDDVILRIWQLDHWLRWLISYGIGYEICTKNGTNRVTIAEICVFGRFPTFPNTKCLYNSIFSKTSLFTPLHTTFIPQTMVFLTPQNTLLITKLVGMIPPLYFCGKKMAVLLTFFIYWDETELLGHPRHWPLGHSFLQSIEVAHNRCAHYFPRVARFWEFLRGCRPNVL